MQNFLSTFLAAVFPSAMMANLPAQNLTDMVLVNDSNQAFYIDIFEPTATQVNAIVRGAASNDPNKAARITRFENAVAFCERQGKRVPTQQEWMAAASNLGRNRNYTLRGDALQDARGNLLVNINGNYREADGSTGSASPYLTSALGIDAIGTVGMTGNRAEWVYNNRASGQCGSRYEENNIANARLDRICSAPLSDSATVRCVTNANGADTVTYSANVSGELLTYLNQIGGRGNGAPPAVNPPAGNGRPNNPPARPGNNRPGDDEPEAPVQGPPPEPKYDNEFGINPDQPLAVNDARVLPVTDYLIIYHETAEYFAEETGLELTPGVYVASRGILNTRSDLQNLLMGGVWTNPFGDLAPITAGYASGVAGPETRDEIWASQNNQYFRLQDGNKKLQAIVKGVPYKIFPATLGAFFLTKDRKVTFVPRKAENTKSMQPFKNVKVLNENYVTLTRDKRGLILLTESKQKNMATVSILRFDGKLTPLVDVAMEDDRIRASVSADGIFIPTKQAKPDDRQGTSIVGYIRLADDGSVIDRRDNIFETRPGQDLVFEAEWPEVRVRKALGGRISYRVAADGSLHDKARGGDSAATPTGENLRTLKTFAEHWTEKAANGDFDDLMDRDDYIGDALNVMRANKNTWVNINGPFGVGKTTLLKLIARTVNAQSAAKKDWVGYQVFHLPLSSVAALMGTQVQEGGQGGAAPQAAPSAEQPINRLLEAVAGKKVILVMDDFLDDPKLGPTNVQKSLDVFLGAFREKIVTGQLKIVTTTDARLWVQAFDQNPALGNMVTTVTVQSAGMTELAMILGAEMRALEKHWRLKFDAGVLDVIINSAAEIDPTTQEPHRSIKAVNKLASLLGDEVKRSGSQLMIVSEQKARSILLTGGLVDDGVDVEQLGPYLSSKILGQEEAIDRISTSMQSLALGVTSRRGTRAVLFLIGPTGTGKTYASELMAKFLKKEIVKIDMTKFTGFTEQTLYTQKIKSLGDKDYVLILDDIDKSPNANKILTELRPIFDDGVYGRGTKDELSFRNAIVIITGNYAAQLILDAKNDPHEIMKNKVRDYVFADKTPDAEKIPKHVWSRIESSIIIFKGLSVETLMQIAQISAQQLSADMRNRFNISVTLSNRLIANLVHKSAEAELGAVPVQKKIETEVKEKIALHMVKAERDGRRYKIRQIAVNLNSADEIILTDDQQPGFASALKQAGEPADAGEQP
ncbi:MAG: AAA family ATPase [Bacteriovoracia bacterium]